MFSPIARLFCPEIKTCADKLEGKAVTTSSVIDLGTEALYSYVVGEKAGDRSVPSIESDASEASDETTV